MSELNIKESFLNTFQLLSPKQQKIWRYIQWYAQGFRQVFPSQKTIAESVGCHRETVIEAIKKFCQLGWLGSFRRCFRSNLYFLTNELVNIDTTKTETFKKTPEKAVLTLNPTTIPTNKPTENPTVSKTELGVMPVRKTSQEKTVTVQHTQRKEVEHILLNIGISGKDLWCLASYSLLVVSKAVEDFKTRKAKGSVQNLAASLTNRCKAYSLS